jgi:hypothetical protein
MRYVFLRAQCIDDNDVAAPDFYLFSCIDPVGIRDVCKGPETETVNRHFHMPHLHGQDGYITNGE